MTEEDRAARAFRAAIEDLSVIGTADPTAARRRAHRQRRSKVAVGAVAAVMVVLAALVGVPRWFSTSTQVARPAPSQRDDPAPAGWRTDYYRGISFEVPADWGYALDAQPCGPGRPDPPEYQHPFVSLGTSLAGAAGSCAAEEPVTQEHITVVQGPFKPPTQDSATRRDGFWLVIHEVGGVRGSVYTSDRTVGERIVASMTAKPTPLRTGCAPHSPVENSPRSGPAEPFDLAGLAHLQSVVICQYDRGSGRGLRARAAIGGDRANQLLRALQEGVASDRPTCQLEGRPSYDPALALVLRLDTGSELRELDVMSVHCAKDGHTDGYTFDGRTVRSMSLSTCNLLLVPPISWDSTIATGQACT